MLKNKYKIIGMVACFNRIETTRIFLESFYNLNLNSRVELILYLLDDGSTDGTSDMIIKNFPQVKLLRSEGGNYWAGGMRLVYHSIQEVDMLDYTHLFVLNDDIVLERSAVLDTLRVLERSNWNRPEYSYTAVMSMFDKEVGRVVYGGLINKSRLGGFILDIVEPTDEISMAETLNMNAALISRGAIEQIGFLDKRFAHHRADIDFGLRLVRSGGKVLVMPGIHGLCTLNTYRSYNYLMERNLLRRILLLVHPKNEPILERWIFYSRHSRGFGLLIYFYPYLTVFLPSVRKGLTKSRFF